VHTGLRKKMSTSSDERGEGLKTYKLRYAVARMERGELVGVFLKVIEIWHGGGLCSCGVWWRCSGVWSV